MLIENYGNGIAIGIGGEAEDIRCLSNQLYNWEVTASEPMHMTENFAYVLSSIEKLGAYLKENGFHVNLKNLETGGVAILRYVAGNRLVKIRAEKFLPERVDFNFEVFGTGKIDNSLPS